MLYFTVADPSNNRHPLGRLRFVDENIAVTIEGGILSWRLVASDEASDSRRALELGYEDMGSDTTPLPSCNCTKWEVTVPDPDCEEAGG